jgi:hypothetical protein
MRAMGFFNDLRATPRRMQAEAEKTRHLERNGRSGTATITALRRTGTFVNENPEIEMDLQVSVDGMAPYPATCRQVFATLAAPRYHPGATVPVKVDPSEPTSLILA